MEMILRDRVALITGADSGIGRAVACRFAEEGADVFILDLNDAAARETADAVAGLGRRAGWARLMCRMRGRSAPASRRPPRSSAASTCW